VIEKKISVDDASLLREKVRKRDRRISETFMAYEEQSEYEVVSAFLGLLSSATRYSLVIVNYSLMYLSLSDASLSYLQSMITCDSYCNRDGTNG